MLEYFMGIWATLRPIGIFYAHLIYHMGIWYIFPHFSMWYQEKSGKPGRRQSVGKSLAFVKIFSVVSRKSRSSILLKAFSIRRHMRNKRNKSEFKNRFNILFLFQSTATHRSSVLRLILAHMLVHANAVAANWFSLSKI
jgi:hypothetical protein